MDDYVRDLAILSKYHDIIAIRLEDDFDEALPSVGLVTLKDPETDEEIQVWGDKSSFRKKYHNFAVLQRLKWRKECLKRSIPILEINTKDDYFRKVKFFLKNRRKKRS
jgi:uncharacterized protein (DUF58 family)